ncbi:calcium-binding mitochondrial carrier protein Aralar1 [Clonorchis sinensis]|uniref:Calcium-binding mitochondrial carrier protein Aralar1 n=1 Tax=Clonorchis sinensis TaxID=79923 RepID=G7Y6F8_CLOSI|nr:calcium-binding mitochondrial carrier protein Aralar1 [Clonorchis sinensis]
MTPRHADCGTAIIYQAIPHRANADSLRNVFLKYASVVTNGEHYMTSKDFVIHFLRLIEEQNNNQTSVSCLARAADTTKDGLISFDEFLALEALLCTSDALYALAFEIFDSKGRGYLEFEDFKEVFQLTSPYARIPFNFDCDFINLHFGKDRSRNISYQDFTQVIHDVANEHAVQAFKSLDEAHSGTISASDFNKIMILLKGHLLTPFVRENLLTAALQGESHGRITFAYYMGFISLLSNMELVKKIFRNRTHGHQNHELTKEELLTEAQNYAQVTPMEVDILFQLTSLLRSDGRISYKELVAVSPLEDSLISYHNYAHGLQEVVHRKVEVKGRTMFLSVLEQIYRFSLGSVAGAVGATAVYPIDLVKTRMQNQRTGSLIGELMYKNSWDCFKKVIQFEGFAGLYRGLGPQLVGVAPEKAIKLTVNDLVRDQFTSSSGSISLAAEILAGACAGASQVVFTNPLEIVKIRLQVAGEIASTKRISAITVIKDLGFFGLYKGARACFLRDIPFSAIYFTAYSHLKQTFADEKGFNSPATLLAAATLSGAPAACLTTPADVIKTRLQVEARKGQTTYSGLVDAAKKIWREEGGRAFWKGAGARVFRSSPQFGITLLTYEMLQRVFHIDFGGRELTGTGIDRHVQQTPVNPDHIGGYRFATAAFTGLETKLGLSFPKYTVT